MQSERFIRVEIEIASRKQKTIRIVQFFLRNTFQPINIGMSDYLMRAGPDQKKIRVRKGERTISGPDGRLIAFAKDSTYKFGKDGRAVEIPKGWTYKFAQNGRVVPIPPRARTVRDGKGGLIVVPEGSVPVVSSAGIFLYEIDPEFS